MAMFRAKKLDLSGYVNIKIIRDHTKRLSLWKPLDEPRWRLPGKSSQSMRQRGMAWNSTSIIAAAPTLHQIAFHNPCPGSTELSLTAYPKTSSTLHHPQHHPSSTDSRSSAATTIADALLYQTNADTEPVYRRREGSWRVQRLSHGKGRPLSVRRHYASGSRADEYSILSEWMH